MENFCASNMGVNVGFQYNKMNADEIIQKRTERDRSSWYSI